MAVKIKPIGVCFQFDDEGNLVNPARISNIPVKWHQGIDRIKESYLQFYQKELDSLYLRGSIVRGTFVEEVSDIDVLGLVLRDGIKWEHTPFEETICNELRNEFPSLNRLELMISTCSSDLSKTYPELASILKTQSLCIWGNDITEKLPPCKPDRSLLIHYKWLEKDVSAFMQNENKKIADYQAIMKIMIRCGFELVMEKSNTYTLDLYPATQLFGQFYPLYRKKMEQVLFYFLNPNESPPKQKELIRNFGKWLVKEINSTLK